MIGKGSFGLVYSVTCDGEEFCAKVHINFKLVNIDEWAIKEVY